MRSGRLERRTRLAIPVRISSIEEPPAGERSTTENICSLGIRMLVRRARESNERLLIKSADGELEGMKGLVSSVQKYTLAAKESNF
jgi:hypothetical protein